MAVLRRLFIAVSLLITPVCWPQQDVDLWGAIARGRLELIHEYLQAGGDPNAVVEDQDGHPWPLLQIALFDRQEAIALALLEAGADFGRLGVHLNLVVAEGLPKVLVHLLASDRRMAQLLATPIGQAELISPAAARGYHQVLEALLEESRRLGISWDHDVLTEAVALAISFRHDDLARILLRFGAPSSGMTVRVAARDGSPGIVRHLLELGADATSQLPEDEVDPSIGARTAIEFAWLRYSGGSGERREMARLILHELLQAGAYSDRAASAATVARDGRAELATIDDASERLVRAAGLGFYDEVEALLRSRSELTEEALREAAMIAFRSLHNDIARLLMVSGISADGGVLHAAARGNSPGLVRDLLTLGANANERVDGRSPIEEWWERASSRDIGPGGDYVLHELIRGGADACWLAAHEAQLNAFEATFLRQSARECWAEVGQD